MLASGRDDAAIEDVLANVRDHLEAHFMQSEYTCLHGC
jgi:hypothetical protein